MLLSLVFGTSCDRRDKSATNNGRAVDPSAAAPHAAAIDSFRRPDVLLAAIGIQTGQTVAEIGAGGGYLTQKLAAAVGPTGKVVATDIDEAALASLRSRLAALPQVEARRVQPAESGLEVGRYDVIVLADVVHLLPQPERYLPALFLSLRPGGHLFVSGREDRRPLLDDAAVGAGLRVRPLLVSLPAQFVVELLPPK